MPTIKVLIIDDSALMRQILSDVLSSDPDIQVVGTAPDPYIGWDKIKALSPDVVTLDVEMPRMDGLTFLERLMGNRPTPVVMISSLTERSCDITFRALEAGAVDFVTKPKLDMTTGTMALAQEIIEKVKSAAQARPKTAKRSAAPRAVPTAQFRTTHKVIAIGTSTGGCEALSAVLEQFPADAPGTVAVIHMPEGFTKSFAARLNKSLAIRVSEAQDGDAVLPGHVLIAPGNLHTSVVRSGAMTKVRVASGDPVNRHRPSVDVLFRSCAEQLGPNAVAAILTGMGDDGARGLLAMRKAGARTMAQNEATCVVFGMPKEAIALGGAEEVLPLSQIPGRILQLV